MKNVVLICIILYLIYDLIVFVYAYKKYGSINLSFANLLALNNKILYYLFILFKNFFRHPILLFGYIINMILAIVFKILSYILVPGFTLLLLLIITSIMSLQISEYYNFGLLKSIAAFVINFILIIFIEMLLDEKITWFNIRNNIYYKICFLHKYFYIKAKRNYCKFTKTEMPNIEDPHEYAYNKKMIELANYNKLFNFEDKSKNSKRENDLDGYDSLYIYCNCAYPEEFKTMEITGKQFNEKILNQAKRELMKKYHPDNNPGVDESILNEKCSKITNAYKKLYNAIKERKTL